MRLPLPPAKLFWLCILAGFVLMLAAERLATYKGWIP
jgi:hypothetical protein